ncbi:Chemotaxis protein CheV [hydrothermal vent metagenome]|uniref:Chemotaxis protein CheV n=1 Tax=hydrothermal vent metagenome TaxID=652676 RepID=A0A3B1AZG6_9ZZZZ
MPDIKDRPEDINSQQDLLLFYLGSNQAFGINVLKMKEIIPYESLTQLPGAHPAVVGVARLRGHPLPVIDLSAAIGMHPIGANSDLSPYSIIISEFSRMLQGFLVSKVDRIISLEWKDILPPPAASGRASYITGVIQVDGRLVEILDVERVMHSVSPQDAPADHGLDLDPALMEQLSNKLVMLVDDSSLARKQISKTLDLIGLNYISATDGKDALDKLHELQEEGRSVDLIISDIEMPEVDGYSLTREIRKDESLSSVYILLHTSLSGSVSDENTQASGADAALAKFMTEELAAAVVKGLTSGK